MARTDLVVGDGNFRYAVERPWGDLPSGMRLAGISDIAVDSKDRVYLYQRTDPPIVIFDSNGAYVGSWGSGVIADAHGIFCTPDDRILVTDRDAHQVLIFDTQGNLLSSLGERHSPRFEAPFNHPADVTEAPDGTIFVADGYANSRVHAFSADGRLQHSFGVPGGEPGQFAVPHAVRVHPDGRVLVADRENDRVQVFSKDGEHLATWTDFYRPMDIFVNPEGYVFVTDHVPRMHILAADGTVVGRTRPVLNGAHGIFGDSAGNIYLAEATAEQRITKLRKL